jgi:hypothetical protein
VNFLRTKKREGPSKPTPFPMVRDDKKDNLVLLLNHYGLSDFFYPPAVFLPLDIGRIEVLQSHGSSVDVAKSENKIQFTKVSESNDHDFVACNPSLDTSSGEGSFWKVTIQGGNWVYLGIIGYLGASIHSFSDSTSYGWTSGSRVYHGGKDREGDSGWTNFTQGECLHFHLKTNKLNMFSVQKNKRFVMDITTTVPAYYIHFNLFHLGTKISLEPLSQDEATSLLED